MYLQKWIEYIPLMKITVAHFKVALSYHKVRGLYFLAVVIVTTTRNIMVVIQDTHLFDIDNAFNNRGRLFP